jgi:hypothetical protein
MHLSSKTKVVHGVKVKRLLPSSQKRKTKQLVQLNEQFRQKQLTALLYQRQNMALKKSEQIPTKEQLHNTAQAFEAVDKVIKKIRKLEKSA